MLAATRTARWSRACRAARSSSCLSIRPSRLVELLAHVVEGLASVSVVAHLFPHAPGHLARAPHHLAIDADHVDGDHAVDPAPAVELDHPYAFLEQHLAAGEIVHQGR